MTYTRLRIKKVAGQDRIGALKEGKKRRRYIHLDTRDCKPEIKDPRENELDTQE